MAGAGASDISLDMFAAYCQGRQDNAQQVTPRDEARRRTRQQVQAWFKQEHDAAVADGGATDGRSVDARAASLLSKLQLVWMTTEQRAVLRLQRMFRARQEANRGNPIGTPRWPPRAADAAVAHHALTTSVERLRGEVERLAGTVDDLERHIEQQ